MTKTSKLPTPALSGSGICPLRIEDIGYDLSL
ncbi:MAG: hypothetical protein ACI9O2_000537, partial [Flammeovirgaceae bacterium]